MVDMSRDIVFDLLQEILTCAYSRRELFTLRYEKSFLGFTYLEKIVHTECQPVGEHLFGNRLCSTGENTTQND